MCENIAGILWQKILHAEKEIVAAGDDAHLLAVGDLKDIVARKHFLHIVEASHDRDALQDDDRAHAPQNGEKPAPDFARYVL